MTGIDTWKKWLGIVWAIAAKDIVDGLKNKTILANTASLVFLILFYKFLPVLEVGENLRSLAVYDLGQSRLVAELENSARLSSAGGTAEDSRAVEDSRFEFIQARSPQRLERLVGSADQLRLGLILPADIDQMIADGQPPVLEGLISYWAKAPEVTQAQAFFEAQLANLTGQSIRIDPSQVVYHQIGWGGPGFLAAIGIVLALALMGTLNVTHLILEEKKARTMDALVVSPASAWQIVAGKAIAGVVYCLAACTAVFALNLAVILNWGLLIVATLCGAFFTVALGLLLGSIFETTQQVAVWGLVLFNVLFLPAFLSIITDLMPKALLAIFAWFPTVALSETIQLSFSNHASVGQIAARLALVLASTMLLLLGVVWKMRRADR